MAVSRMDWDAVRDFAAGIWNLVAGTVARFLLVTMYRPEWEERRKI